MVVKRNTWQREAVRAALGTQIGFVSAQGLHSNLHSTGSHIGLAHTLGGNLATVLVSLFSRD